MTQSRHLQQTIVSKCNFRHFILSQKLQFLNPLLFVVKKEQLRSPLKSEYQNWVQYMRTRILGLSGSPRTSSNTAILVETALAAAENEGAIIEFIDLSCQKLQPCEHCNECSQLGRCKIDDNLTTIAEKMKAADGIIWGSPDHFASRDHRPGDGNCRLSDFIQPGSS